MIQQETGNEMQETSQAGKWKQLLSSRKFWAALFALLMIVVKAFWPEFPLAEDQLTNLVYVLMAYILGTAIESRAV